MTRTVFIDRDGVVNVRRLDYVKSWDEFQFLPGALEGLALLTSHNFRLVIVTNQSCVNRSLISERDLSAIHERMLRAVEARGGEVTSVFVCPHRPDEGCGCRKPKPGMLVEAGARYGVTMSEAVMIGDDLKDLEAARRAGCQSILVLSGRIPAWPHDDRPDGCLAVLPGLLDAARFLTGGRESAVHLPARTGAAAGPRQ